MSALEKGAMTKGDRTVVTFGCRLNTYESEVMAPARPRSAGLGALQGGAVIFNTCRPSPPKRCVRPSRRSAKARRREPSSAHHRHRLRGRRPSRRISPPWTRSTSFSAMRRSLRPTPIARCPIFGVNDTEKARRQRHFFRCARRPAIWSTPSRAGARALRAGAKWLRPSLHLLHHPLWTRQIRARCRWAAVVEQVKRLAGQRLCRDRALRRRHDKLWRRPAGRAENWAKLVKTILKQVPDVKRLRPLLDRFHRGR